MFDKTITLEIPPWPNLNTSSYRYFEKDEKHIARIFNEFVLVFMLERTLYFTEAGEDIQVDAGEWYIQRPGLKQEAKKGSPAPVYFYMHFQALESTKKYEKTILSRNAPYIELPIRGNFNAKYLKSSFDQLLFLSKQYPPDILGRQTIFLTILKYLTTTYKGYEDSSQDISIKVMEYLKENYNKDIACIDLTDRFHFTVDYLIRKMKKFCGITPWQYIQHLRIENAKELLENTDYTLATISNYVGYNDLSVFYKAFRKHTGTSPGTWRQTVRGLHI